MEFPAISLNTSCPFWDYDDIPDCQREQLLQTIWPTCICVLTLVWAMIQTVCFSDSPKAKVKPNLEQQPLLGTTDEPAFDDAQQDYGSIKHNPGLSLAEQHFDVTRIEPTRPDGSPMGIEKVVPRSLPDTIRTAVEFIALAAQLGLAVSALIIPNIAAEWSHPYAPLVGVAVWGFLFVVGLVKTLGATTGLGDRLPNYWLPTTIFYILNWPAAALMFRSALLGHTIIPHFYITQFILSTLLVYCAVTIRIVGKYGKIYVSDAHSTPSPEPVSSVFDIFSYAWVDKLIWNAYYTPLTRESLWGLRKENYAYYVIHGFHSMQSTKNLTSKLYRYFGPTVLMQSFWTTLDSFLVFAPTVFLRYILEFVAHPEDTPKSVAWFYVFAMFFFSLGSACASGRALFLGRKICVNMKAVVIGEVYAKALRRRVTAPIGEDDEEKEGSDESSSKSPEAKKSADLGSIINLMAVDAFRIADICAYLHYFVSSLVMVIVAMYLLFDLLGWSAIVGSLSFVVMTPINYYFTRKMAGYEKDILSYTDKRIQKLNETFQSIRIVKFFAWEENFVKQIMELRNTELKLLLTRLMMWVFASGVYYVTPTLVTVISFYCYTQIEHKVLTTPIAFTALSLFSLLRSPLENFADMLAYVIQSKVSLDRVQEFLDEEDCDKYEQLSVPRTPDCPLVGFKNATMAWSTNSKSDFRLRDIDISFEEGKLNVIIGATGAGKTSLLLGLLGEMHLVQGQVFLPGSALKDTLKPDPVTGLTESVAYCSQSAWLLNATIKDNILFANPYEPVRYRKVIEACGLKRDFETLSAGDQTEIGEKGIALSGGQKQRVSLARALYSRARYVLLDDCLSAVDSHTSSHIYENCITGELMKLRTCILVSHNIALTMQQASYVVVMENGRVKAKGTPEKLLEQGHLGDDEMVKTSVMGSRSASSTQLSSLGNALDVEEVDRKICEEELAEPVKETTDGKLVEEESKSEGAVAWVVYKRYFIVFGGYVFTAFVLSSLLLNQFVYFMQSYWLRIWALAEDNRTALVVTTAVSGVSRLTETVNNYMRNSFLGAITAMDIDWHKPLGGEAFRIVSKGEHSTLFYIYIYGAIGICFTTVSALRIAFVSWGGVRASRQMFETLLRVTMRAKLRFFDSTPVGRIMNRFSKDIEEVDQHLSPIADAFLMSVVSCLWTLGVICIVTPSFLFFGVFISLSYYVIGIFYTYASRELKRFESISRSPIHQLFTETLVGVTTIRAYGDERRFMKQILAAIDGSNKPFYYLWIANRWLAFRSDLLGAGISFFASAFVLISSDYIDAGMAGISLSYAISFTQSSLWVVRLYANIEMSMNAVERIQEYSDLEQEPPAEIPETQPPPSWPEKGAIEVKDVSLRYAPQLPLVIKNVSFDIEPNMKVGIVGRTGAGKSTIITAFFRFLDPETGYIKVDGVDITTIGLKTLRQAITIIPQDPTLFTGTIRSNLDPFGKYTDLDMFEALRRVSLITQAELTETLNAATGATTSTAEVTENRNKFLSLDAKITEGGSNLSQGQRQLMCLARSLLMAPKVILLDEATASIDYKSDAQIQNTIRQEFSQSTILTIAHRLRSIIDYDKILVMDAGEVVEYADPYTLIIDKNSQFRSLCNDSGELDTLIQLAKESFVARKARK